MSKPPAVPVTGVWLLSIGDQVLVLIERDGIWYQAIREYKESNFSHNISGHGILALKEPAYWLYREDAKEQPSAIHLE